MRPNRLSVVVLSVLALVAAVLVALAASDALAQSKKVSVKGKSVSLQSQNVLHLQDQPGHQLIIWSTTEGFTSSDPDWNNVQSRAVAINDYIQGSGPNRGYHAITHPGGDQTFTEYQGATKRTTNPDGTWTSTFGGTWRFTGGTGRFKGISGGGTYKGQASQAGGEYEFDAEYTVTP